jgi:hypothetical protein
LLPGELKEEGKNLMINIARVSREGEIEMK